MDFLERIKETIEKHSMFRGGETVLIGLSGGADSVCLLTLLKKLSPAIGIKLHAVYIDHGLRPNETEKEIAFLKDLTVSMEIPLTIKSADVKAHAKEHGMSKQESGRQLRYELFDLVSYEISATKVALGHNMDDQIETFFMRILRGSGPKGLSAIPPKRGNIIRPLIETQRKDIEGFLEKEKIPYTEDSSNLKDDYLRNKIRHSLIPRLEELNPNLRETISKTVEIFREEDRYFETLVTKTMMKLISRKNHSSIELFLAPLETMDRVILRRTLRRAVDETKGLREIGFTHIEDIIGLIEKGRHGNRLYLPKGVRAIKQYSTLKLTSEPSLRLGTYMLQAQGEVVLKEAGVVLEAELMEGLKEKLDGRSVAVFDGDKLSFPLCIRAREKGDFFYPYGFGKRKKIQDFFVDEKLPKDERDKTPIVLSGSEIIWVLGMRQDDRFKATPETKRFTVLKVKYLRG